MIEVSYKDFIPDSGNIQLEKTEDKLQHLFLVDKQIKLKEMDKVYTIDNINDFIQDVSLLLEKELKGELDNDKQELDEDNDNIYGTWWGKIIIIFAALYLISMLTSFGWGTKEFSREYSSKYGVPFSEVERVVDWEYSHFPIPYKRYKIEYNDGREKTIGYRVFGIIFVTEKI